MQKPADLQGNSRIIALWLGGVAGLVFAMIVVGGITRLTGSGLSMVEWRPVMGFLPPLGEAEWERVFALYRESPEYLTRNRGMDIAGFKAIFFWEYVHRVLGRLIGLAYGLPLLIFAWRKMIPQGYGGRLLALLILGGAQGVIGWWMVKSGLAERADVSQYRLAIHLGLALVIFAALLWTAFDMATGKTRLRDMGAHCMAVLTLLAITMVAGAFVAGLDGGLVYNEYPFMGGALIPFEYELARSFDDAVVAQFHHRHLGLLTFLAVLSLYAVARRYNMVSRYGILAALVFAQFIIGLATLLLAVPVALGVLHQAGAALLLAAMIYFAHGAAAGFAPANPRAAINIESRK